MMPTHNPQDADNKLLIEYHLFEAARADRQVVHLLMQCVGRVLQKQAKAHKSTLRLPALDATLHIADWVKAAIVNDEPWLKRKDELGRVRKLMKFSTIDQIVKEANKAMLKASQKQMNIKLKDGDEELLAQLSDGYYIVKLLTPSALDRESGEMQHCIGNGGYDELLTSKWFSFFSLRDGHGKAHATIEVEDKQIKQIQGKQNKVPAFKYLKPLGEFIKAHDFKLASHEEHFPYILDKDGVWHHLADLPETLIAPYTSNLEMIKTAKLPKVLHLGGNLDLQEGVADTLPEDLRVDGYLNLVDMQAQNFPKTLIVKDSLYLAGVSIECLPETFHCGRQLNLMYTNIKTLPDNLVLKGGLQLTGTQVTRLPKGLHVGMDLSLSGCHIDHYPDETFVERDIDMSQATVNHMPDQLKVRRDLSMAGATITAMPKLLIVARDLSLRNASVTKLPERLEVGETLDISSTEIAEIPEGTKVGDEINIQNTKIISLPASIRDDCNLYTDFGYMSAKEFRDLMATREIPVTPTKP